MKNIFIIWLVFLFLTCNVFSQGIGWKEIGKMNIPVSGGEIVFNGSKTNPKFYILGGYSRDAQRNVKTIQIFDPNKNTIEGYSWDMRIPRADFVAACWDSSIVYFGGGVNDSLEAFNFVKKEAPRVIDKNINFSRMLPSGLVIGDELFVISGNYPPLDTLPYIVSYNLKKKSITYGLLFPPSAFSNSFDGSVFQKDNYIYILGGIVNKYLSKKISRFDLTTKLYQDVSGATLLNVRAGSAATVIPSSRKGVVVGGYNETSIALNTAEQIVVRSDGSLKVSPLPSLNYPRRNPMVVAYENRVFVFGGTDLKNNVVSQIEMYADTLATDIVQENLPINFNVEQNYPNPFNPHTTINLSLPKASRVSIKIYNVLGQIVSNLADDLFTAGVHSIEFYSNDLPSGIYFYKVESNNVSVIKKMLLLK